MRTNLKVFRIKKKLTQAEIAAKIGVSRGVYSYIEQGKRGGTPCFWGALQYAFNIPDEEMYPLQKLDEGEEQQ